MNRIRTQAEWVQQAEETQRRLGRPNFRRFVDWLEDNSAMLAVYERNLDEVLAAWDRYDALRLPEGL